MENGKLKMENACPPELSGGGENGKCRPQMWSDKLARVQEVFHFPLLP
jgi:hypothetical protein